MTKLTASFLTLALVCSAVVTPHSAQAQLTSPNYQLDVNGVGEAGVGAANSANFGVRSNNGPVFVYDSIVDTDGDGIPDVTEIANGTNPNDPNDPTTNGAGDDDGDGVTNAVENLIGGNSTSTTATQDTDGDGVPDVIEVALGTDWLDPNDPVTNGGSDSDSDGVTDAVESALCTAYPSLASCPDPSATDDSDGDGISDVDEFLTGSDPTDADDPTTQTSGGGGSSSGGGNNNTNDDVDDVTGGVIDNDQIVPTEVPVIVPTSFTPAPNPVVPGDTLNSEPPAASDEPTTPVLEQINDRLRIEDASLANEDLTLIIDRQVFALIPNEDGSYSLTSEFDTGGEVRLTVPADALGLDDEGEIVVVITERNLGSAEQPQAELAAQLAGRYIYDVRVFAADGRELTSFNAPLTIVIVVPETLRGLDDLGVYFIEEQAQVWERVPDVQFTDTEATFTVDHLTTFAIWSVATAPNEMPIAEAQSDDESKGQAYANNLADDNLASCGLRLFGFVPLCWPWPVLYVVLVLLIFYYGYRKLTVV